MERYNLFKHWKLTLTIVIAGVNLVLTYQAAFASMGSTGGGGSSSTGGGGSSSSTGSSSSISGDHHTSDGSKGRSLRPLLRGALRAHYYCRGSCIPSIGASATSRKAVNGLAGWMLTPNMKIKDFKRGLKNAKIRLKTMLWTTN